MISRGAEPANPARDSVLDPEASMTPTAPTPLRLAPEVLRPLQKLSTTRSFQALLGTWGLIVASIAAALWSGHWAVWIVAAIVNHPNAARSQAALDRLVHWTYRSAATYSAREALH